MGASVSGSLAVKQPAKVLWSMPLFNLTQSPVEASTYYLAILPSFLPRKREGYTIPRYMELDSELVTSEVFIDRDSPSPVKLFEFIVERHF